MVVSIELRGYQEGALDSLSAAYRRGRRAPLLVAPTGSGKTVLFTYIAQRAAAKGNRTLILVHRQELVRQTSRKLDAFGVQHGLVISGAPSPRGHMVLVASVQTLVRRLDRWDWLPDLIVIDEGHHAVSGSTWGRILDYFGSVRRLGCTATPERLDGRGLGVRVGGYFDELVMSESVQGLTAQGYLSPARVFAPASVDIGNVKTRGGDYAKDQLAHAMDKPSITGDAVQHYRQYCDGAPALAFCVSVAHAEHVASTFAQHGFQAASIDGGMDDSSRKHRIDDLGNGKLNVLTSCEIVSEGTDIPIVAGAILLRPTQSLGLYLQQVGRVLRPYPGKKHAVILDHVGNVMRHGLPDDNRDWDLNAARRSKRKNSDTDFPIRQCERCYHVYKPASVCPSCGFTYPVQAREIMYQDGDLEEVDVVALRRQRKREQSSADSLEALQEIGRQRGYKPGWAYKVWQSRMKKRGVSV